MTLDKARARQFLASGDLRTLFVDALGWDRHTATLDVSVADAAYRLQALAQKRGMVAWHCPAPAGQRLPDYARRRKIEHQVAKSAHEHLIVFTDAANETQVWQWVRRELGKPTACREHTFHRSQPGDALLQKLEAIAFTLEEEERLSLTDVTRRARVGFDVETVTKRFYDRFQKEHATFLQFISGIPERADHEWYASVMLNRLMFVYFIQRKGFLDGDRDYLRNRLNRLRAEHGRDRFYSFYRYFLLRLFHEGLGGINRSADLEKLIGCIPYLNGSLFDVHELERPDRYGKSIEIPDQAFERIFDYFDQYQWHLDERPLRADNEINPDVLGYIFEKYINQKQMGAYYTKEDITEYISKNTVLPSLFDTARAKCRVAFENPKGPTVWDLLRDDPDRYIYPAVRHGVGELLPEDIAAGLNPPTLNQPVGEVASVNDIETIHLRKNWNKSAPATHALPTETWREVIARRKRYEEVRASLAADKLRDTNDLITLNLDIRQFAQDVIENCEGPELLRALWHAIEKVTILDPTCGSGAFLFAALNILEPLYEGCLDRMEAFVADLDRSDAKHRPEKFSDFRKVLANVAAHPNRRYFIFKSIILNNLYGVDIMEEAVEICKLRLFLKLAAQVEPDLARPNLGIEPLPDIDFNIRAGNTLVGYGTYDEVQRAVTGKLDYHNAMEKISVKAADLQEASDAFRARQVVGDGSVPAQDKQELRKRLNALDDELNRYLASDYDVEPGKKDAHDRWLKSHQPFHWFVEFYGIMSSGGFDVIIGNPPYVSRAKIAEYSLRGYRTDRCPDIYAPCVERSTRLLQPGSRFGMILPISFQFSDEFGAVRRICEDAFRAIWVSTYSRNPAALFSAGLGVRSAITLAVAGKSETAHIEVTRLNRWVEEARQFLFESLTYTALNKVLRQFGWPRLGSPGVAALLEALVSRGGQLHRNDSHGDYDLRFKTTALYYLSVFVDDPPSYDVRGTAIPQTKVGSLNYRERLMRDRACAIALGKLGLLWWMATGDDFDVTARGLGSTPVDPHAVAGPHGTRLDTLAKQLVAEMRQHVIYTKYAGKVMGNYDVKYLRDLTDQVDQVVLASHGLEGYWEDVELAYQHFMKMTGERPGTTRGSVDGPSDDGLDLEVEEASSD